MTKKKTEQKIEVGRPTLYSDELAELIINLMLEGKTLTDICKLETMPCRSTVYYWLDDNPSFLDAYNSAKVKSTHAMVENALHELNNVPIRSIWIDKNGIQYETEEVDQMMPMERKQLGLENVGLSPALVTLRHAQFKENLRIAGIRNPDDYSEKKRVEMSGGQRVQFITKEEKEDAVQAIKEILDEK